MLHTDFSLLDGYGMVEEYAARWKSYGGKYLCISDHGMMAAIPRQIKACEPSGKKDDPNKDKRLSPIFACELYVNPMQIEYSTDAELKQYIGSLNPQEQAVMRKRGFHLLAIAATDKGYSNLVKLTSTAWTKGFYYRPRVNHEQLKQYKEGIIFTSCCYASEIGQAFDSGGEDAGNVMIEKYIEMFSKENFYLEIMLLDFIKQKPYDAFIIKASQRYGLRLIVTNDCFVADTQVLTKRGSIPVQDVRIGDLVLTHKGRYRKVIYTNSRYLSPEEKVYRVVASCGTYAFEATGNHPVYAHDGAAWSWVSVHKLQKGYRLQMTKPDELDLFHKDDLRTIDIMEMAPSSVARLYFDPQKDAFVTHQGTDHRHTVTIPRALPVTDDLLRILGLYVSEGSVHAESEVSFGTHKRECSERELICRYFQQFGLHPADSDRGENGKATRFSSVIFKAVLEYLGGKKSTGKKLPGFCSQVKFSKRQMAILLSQYIAGDGHRSIKRGYPHLMIPSTSAGLIEAVRAVLASWGIPVCRTERNYKEMPPKHKNHNADPAGWNTLYILNLGGKKLVALEECLRGEFGSFRFDFTYKVLSVFPVVYDLKVYNLQVEEDETYNANGWAVHNCHYCNQEDSKYQRLMLMVQTNNTMKDIERRMAEEGMQDMFELQDQNLWMKTEEEINAKWESDYSDVIDYELFKQAKMNTVEICRRAAGVKLDRSIKLPQIDNADDKLKEAAVRGLFARGLGRKLDYQARLKEEIALITHKEFSSYFLIQKMMTDEARRVCKQLLGWGTGKEAVGPGRGCLAGDTPIVLANGRTKPICDVKEGDFVITRDGTPRLVERTASYDVEEDLLRFRCYYGDRHGVTLTADHKILAEKWRRPEGYDEWTESTNRSRKIVSEPTGQLEWVRADRLTVGDWVFIPKPAAYAEPQTEIDLAEYGDGSATSCDGTHVYQDWINPLTNQIRDRKRLCRKFVLDNDWYVVLGIFAGDGWLRSDGSGRVGFCFHKGDSYGLALVRHKLESIGVPVNVRDGHRGKLVVSLDANSRHLHNLFADWFDEYQCTSATKHVPLFVLCAEAEQVRAFLRGYHMSDGNEGFVNKFTTTSAAMADQIRYLHWRLGEPASLSAKDRTDPRTGSKYTERSLKTPRVDGVSLTPERKAYQFRQVEGGILVRLRSVEIVRGIKKVYDLQVAGNHNYLTSSFLVHNSAVGSLVCYCLGITDVDPIKHDLLFKRFLSETRGGKSIKLRFKNIDPLPEEAA